MDQPGRHESTFVCHPDDIIPSTESPPEYRMNIASRDLLSLSRAIKDRQVFRGDFSAYAQMFQETDVFTRFVYDGPLRVRTFIPQKKLHTHYFFEFPAQLPPLSLFAHKAVLLEKRRFTCAECESQFTGYYYYKQNTTEDSTRQALIEQLDGVWRKMEKKDKSKELSEGGGEHGTRKQSQGMLRKVVKKARKYICKGVKGVNCGGCRPVGIKSHHG
jgi:hypothetical protein